jgi:hypothetical protein
MSECPMCGQDEPASTEHAHLMRARHAVMEAWKAGHYAERFGSRMGFIDVTTMIDDAIQAVRTADAESSQTSTEEIPS